MWPHAIAAYITTKPSRLSPWSLHGTTARTRTILCIWKPSTRPTTNSNSDAISGISFLCFNSALSNSSSSTVPIPVRILARQHFHVDRCGWCSDSESTTKPNHAYAVYFRTYPGHGPCYNIGFNANAYAIFHATIAASSAITIMVTATATCAGTASSTTTTTTTTILCHPPTILILLILCHPWPCIINIIGLIFL